MKQFVVILIKGTDSRSAQYSGSPVAFYRSGGNAFAGV